MKSRSLRSLEWTNWLIGSIDIKTGKDDNTFSEHLDIPPTWSQLRNVALL